MPDKQYEDFLFSFERGVNSGVEAVLLLKNQLAWGENVTVRGGYATHRPPIKRQTLNYQGNTPQDQAALQAAVEQGKFQGSAVYRPDTGLSQIVAAISGRLFAFIPIGTTWNVSEIMVSKITVDTGATTVYGGGVAPNPNWLNAEAEQVWMTQAEKWLIIRDGISLPAFYDGATCRTSYGASVVLATAAGVPVPNHPPAIGSTITVTTTAPYAGQINMPVLFHGEYYEINTFLSGYKMRLGLDTGGVFVGSFPAGSEFYTTINSAGVTTGNAVLTAATWSGVVDVATSIASEIGGVIHYTAYNPVVSAEMIQLAPVAGPFSGWYSIAAGVQFTLPFVGPVPAIPLDTHFTIPVRFAYSISPDTRGIIDNSSRGYWSGSMECKLVSIAGATAVFEVVTGLDQMAVLGGQNTHRGYRLWPIYVPAGSNIPAIGYVDHQPLVKLTAACAFAAPAPQFSDAYVEALVSTPTTGTPCALYLGAGSFFEGFTLFNVGSTPTGTLYLKNLSDPPSVTLYASGLQILSVPELPAGKMMAYDMSRLWLVLPSGVDFVAGDIVGGASGTPANDYRDAVLKFTENEFLEGGGKFRIPSSGNLITALTFTPVLDTSFGLGPLQVSTQRSMYSCNTPVDRTTWFSMTNPILSPSLKGDGPVSHHATVLANSDIIFRSAQGLNTFVMGRRSFDSWGNTGVGQEMRRLFNADDRSFLEFASAVNHNNRLMVTASPRHTNQGVVHGAIAVLNFDLISGMTSKAEPVYDGAWSFGDVFRLFSGEFGATTRAFAFMLDASGAITLHELLLDGAQGFDHVDTAINWSLETAMVFNKDVKSPEEIVNLLNGEIYVKDVHGAVSFTVLYRPDFHPTWIPWTSFYISADATSLTGYRTPLGFGKPTIDGTAENANNRSFPNGHFFQVRVEITGDCKVTAMRFAASQIPKTPFAPPVSNTPNPVQLITSAGQDLPMP